MRGVRERGPEASIDELADEAGVSKPVLYDEFGGKLGIADAIAVELAQRLERQVIEELSKSGEIDVARAVATVVDALITLIDAEPELYSFLVRAIRVSDRGFLDNALIRVIHERAALMVGLVVPAMATEHLDVLTDGLFGFVFASVESWQPNKKPPKDVLVHSLSTVIVSGLQAVARLDPDTGR